MHESIVDILQEHFGDELFLDVAQDLRGGDGTHMAVLSLGQEVEAEDGALVELFGVLVLVKLLGDDHVLQHLATHTQNTFISVFLYFSFLCIQVA